jgi:hypothetical protein
MPSGDGAGHPTTADHFGPLGDGSASRRPVIGGFHPPYVFLGTVYPRGYAPSDTNEALPPSAGFVFMTSGNGAGHPTMADCFRPLDDGSASHRPVIGEFHPPYVFLGNVQPAWLSTI